MPEEQKTKSKADIEKNKVIAALSYFGILCLVPLFGKKHSKFAQFHAKQGLVLCGLEILCMFIYGIPLFGWLVLLLFFAVSVIGIMKVLNGEWWKMPYIYEWSKKINL